MMRLRKKNGVTYKRVNLNLRRFFPVNVVKFFNIVVTDKSVFSALNHLLKGLLRYTKNFKIARLSFVSRRHFLPTFDLHQCRWLKRSLVVIYRRSCACVCVCVREQLSYFGKMHRQYLLKFLSKVLQSFFTMTRQMYNVTVQIL